MGSGCARAGGGRGSRVNLIFRLLAVLLSALRGARIHPLGESVVRFTVLPHDLDLNVHMNNGRYLAVMDLGRLDMMTRIGVTRHILRNRWQPVVGSLTIRYRRALRPFQRYSLRSRVLCWDEKWFYIEQRFERRGEIVAQAYVKGLFLGPRGKVAPQEVIGRAGLEVASPSMPEAVSLWLEAEGLAREEGGRRRITGPGAPV